jgi:transposase
MILPVLAWAELELGRPAEAGEIVERALARARPEGMRLALVEALRVRAVVALRQERWDEAAASVEEGLALARAMPHPYAEARLLYLSAALHRARGEWDRAQERFSAALALFRQLGASGDAAQVERDLAAPLQNQPAATGTTRVTVVLWGQILPLLPAPAGTGRRRADDRQTLDAILYKQSTGCGWGAVPATLGDGVTAYRRLRQLRAAGIWDQIRDILQGDRHASSTSRRTPVAGAGSPPELSAGAPRISCPLIWPVQADRLARA